MPDHSPATAQCIATALRQSYVFSQMSDDEMALLVGAAEWKSHPQLEVILREGQACDALYILASGRLVVKEAVSEEGELIIARIKPGDVVGEMAFLSQQVASATVRTDGAADLVRLEYLKLRELLAANPMLELKFFRALVCTLSERLRKGNQDLRRALLGSALGRL
jgi:CRP-like cAMP-binding protein